MESPGSFWQTSKSGVSARFGVGSWVFVDGMDCLLFLLVPLHLDTIPNGLALHRLIPPKNKLDSAPASGPTSILVDLVLTVER
jgi:hypothetical protein